MKRFWPAVAIGLGATCLALALWAAGALTGWEARLYDLRAAGLAHARPPAPAIRLILLDQASLDWGKARHLAWPWPREVYRPMLDFCRRAGARAVALDMEFFEPSYMGVDDDALLGAAVRASGMTVGAVFAGEEMGSATNWPADVPRPRVRLEGAPAPGARYAMPRAAFPIREVATNAAMLATVRGNPSRDGIYRRVPPFALFDGQVLPALGVAAVLVDRPAATLRLEDGGRTLAVAGRRLPLDAGGQIVLRYRGRSQTHPAVNIAGVIQSEVNLEAGKAPLVDPGFFSNAVVFVGSTAPALLDLKPTPVAGVYPAVEIQATLADNILTGEAIRVAPRVAGAALALVVALLAALGIRVTRKAWHSVPVIVAALAVPPALGVLAYAFDVWLSVMPALTAVATALVGTLILNYATEGRQRRWIKGAFAQYLSADVIEQLQQDPGRLRLGGETRELTMLFSDVQGFTSLSEGLSPADLTSVLNDYLTAMTDEIYAAGGTVDKYEGDAIIAFWNAPLPQSDHAARAVRAALRCHARLVEIRPALRAQTGRDLVARIGINSGPVVVGNMGSVQRFNYTFLGDAGNLASRLEGINKQFGTTLLISEATRRQLPADWPVREISRVRVVGRAEPVTVFEPLAPEAAAARAALHTAFARGLAAYYAGRFDEAAAAFAPAVAEDPAAAAYAKRCAALQAAPPAAWDGVWTMTEK